MREYKFRIRCKRVISQTNHSSITTTETKFITLKQLERHWITRHFSDECTEILSIDQYIGLNDINNEEIYENDYMEFTHFYVDKQRHEGGIGRVYFDDGSYMVKFMGIIDEHRIKYSSMKIIDTVYTRPESEQ